MLDVVISRPKAEEMADRACRRLQGLVALPPKTSLSEAVRQCMCDMRFVLSEVKPSLSL